MFHFQRFQGSPEKGETQVCSLPRFALYYMNAAHDCKDCGLHLECFKSERELS